MHPLIIEPARHDEPSYNGISPGDIGEAALYRHAIILHRIARLLAFYLFQRNGNTNTTFNRDGEAISQSSLALLAMYNTISTADQFAVNSQAPGYRHTTTRSCSFAS